MVPISLENIQPQKKLFHNQLMDVYPTELPLDRIDFWKDNNRTIFTFEKLRRIKKKELEDISIIEIANFIADQDIHKLQILASSIKRNGVQVPLVIRDDGKLLDGNRRYFACHLIKAEYENSKIPVPEFFKKIPVLVIKKEDLTSTTELKILAEANFIPDLKVSWPLDAQARAVEDFYNEVILRVTEHEAALAEVVSIFGINRQRVVDLLDTLKLTKSFICETDDEEERIKRREIVEEKFVYFWEFLNKAMKGRGAFNNPTELSEVRNMFFGLIGKGRDTPIKNVKQVEPLVQAKRNETAWKMLGEAEGSKLSVVVSMVNDKKESRKDEDIIRVFNAWLKDAKNFSPHAKELLKEVIELATEKLRG
ncbi:MAG: ParB/RepB/Spo0J family partition protein [Methylotenera sp.]|nr:ParB/RepB/Spo0J family partition protein [Methylotenera sp.]